MILNFVLCPRFHGATVLAHLLNNHSAISTLGDMLPSSEFDQTCGCGATVSTCEFWNELDRKFRWSRRFPISTLYPSTPQLISSQRVNNAIVKILAVVALRSTHKLWIIQKTAAGEFASFYVGFTTSVNKLSDSQIFVSGLKSLTTVLAIKSILGEDAEIRVIHLVRDPRGFYCSERTDNRSIEIEESMRRWAGYHKRVLNVVMPLCRAGYLPLRYEDLCEQPDASMKRVFDLLGAEYEDVFRPPGFNHIIGHFTKRHFTGVLRQSTKWRRLLSQVEQRKCLELSRPVSERFGYTD